MNSCIIMAEVIRPPQLRYTQDNQTAIADFKVSPPSTKPDRLFIGLLIAGLTMFAIVVGGISLLVLSLITNLWK